MIRGRYSGSGNKQGLSVTVAAFDAPAEVRAGADFVCDGTNDEVQIQAAIESVTRSHTTTAGNHVELSAGTFNISSPIFLRQKLRVSGQGCPFTKIVQKVNMTGVFMFTDITTAFCELDHLKIIAEGAVTAGAAIYSWGNLFDLWVHDIFISNMAEDGITAFGSWGWVVDNVVVEFCGGNGARFQITNIYTVEGTITGSFVPGDQVTQETTGATGKIQEVFGATSAQILADQGSAAFETGDATYTITKDGDVGVNLETPTSVSRIGATGPKLTNCKIQANVGDQVVLDYNCTKAIISNSEMHPASGNGSASIKILSAGNIIIGNRLLGIGAGGVESYHVRLEKGTDGVNEGNVVADNYLTNTNSLAICISCDITAAGFIRNNSFSNNVIYQGSGTGINIGAGNDGWFGNVVVDASNDRVPLPSTSVTASSVTLTTQKQGKVIDNSDFNFASEVDLPAAINGLEFEFRVTLAQSFTIDPNGTDTLNVAIGGAQGAGGANVSSSTVGSYIKYRCVLDGVWECVEVYGTWAAE